MFLYSNIVNGGGIILFSLLLEMFGFSKATGSEKTKKPRYIILLSTNRTNFQTLIERFNKEDNKYGEYISIIIGSKAISEGFSFKNIQVEYILTPHWNYTETDQAIARGYRYGSHDHLLKDNNNIELKIFQFAAVPGGNMYQKSIDIQMYKTSEIKDMNMKLIERVIKESAIDCALNYNRNYVKGYDNQRDCEYRECDYKCDDVFPSELDYSTDKIFYINSNTNKILLNNLINLFKKKFYIDSQDILVNKDADYIIIFLQQIIDNKIIIYNKYNIPCYLNEKNNIYFLTDNVYLNNNNYLSNYYLINPNIKFNNSFSSVLNNLELDLIPAMINKFAISKNLEKFINKFNMETKELLLEYSIIAKLQDVESNVRNFILKYFEYYYQKINDTWYMWLLYDEKLKNYKDIKCLDESSYEWNPCNKKELETYTKVKEKELEKIRRNIYGFHGKYGKVNYKTGKKIFILVKNEEKTEKSEKIDLRLLFKGQDCKSYDKTVLCKIIYDNFKIRNISSDELEKLKKEELCTIIKNFLESKNLII
jgi:hypothetical protein